jgi:hypothetical protein
MKIEQPTALAVDIALLSPEDLGWAKDRHGEVLELVWKRLKPRPKFAAFLLRHVRQGCPLH